MNCVWVRETKKSPFLRRLTQISSRKRILDEANILIYASDIKISRASSHLHYWKVIVDFDVEQGVSRDINLNKLQWLIFD